MTNTYHHGSVFFCSGDPMFELKQFPNTLKYSYLDEKNIYPVIISANLLQHEEEILLKILKKHRGTIGYTMMILRALVPLSVSTRLI